jgi:hypothetical protein
MVTKVSAPSAWKLFLVLLLFVSASTALAANPVILVAGSWTITVTQDGETANQTITLTQQDNKLTGAFKGSRQQGSLAGTIDGNNIKFHINTRVPFDYTGTVGGEGDSMKGTFTARGKTGDWTAVRAK